MSDSRNSQKAQCDVVSDFYAVTVHHARRVVGMIRTTCDNFARVDVGKDNNSSLISPQKFFYNFL